MKERIKKIGNSGIMCDNDKCDYQNKDVLDEDLKLWINKPCPKCGENLLTLEDFITHETLAKHVKFINGLSDEDLRMLDIKESGKYEKVQYKAHNGLQILNKQEISKEEFDSVIKKEN